MIDGVWFSAVLSILKQMLAHFSTGFLLCMINVSLAFNWNSVFINLLLKVVGSKSPNKWEIVVFFNQQCNLSAVFVEVYEGLSLSGLEKEFCVS